MICMARALQFGNSFPFPSPRGSYSVFLRPAAAPGDLLEMWILHLLIPNLHFNECAEDGIACSNSRSTV